MADSQARGGETRRRRREGFQAQRAQWARELLAAMAERHLTTQEVARAIGTGASTLGSWLKGSTDPDPRALHELAAVVGIDWAYQASTLGYIPPDLTPLDFHPLFARRDAAERARIAIKEADHLLRVATAAADLPVAALVAGALCQRSSEWCATLQPSPRGHKYPWPYTVDVALDRVDGSTTTDENAEDHRAQIERAVGDLFAPNGVDWRTYVQPRPDAFRDHALVLEAPALLVPQVATATPNLSAPPSIVVAGVPFAGGPDVARILADVLGFGFTSLQMEVRRLHGVRPGHPEWVPLQAEICHQLLNRHGDLGRFLVWSFDSVGAFRDCAGRMGHNQPFVVYLHAGDAVIWHAVTSTSDTDARVALDAQHRLEEVLAARDPASWLQVDVEAPADPLDWHSWWDIWVEVTAKVVGRLHERFATPKPGVGQRSLSALLAPLADGKQ